VLGSLTVLGTLSRPGSLLVHRYSHRLSAVRSRPA
jgi:hypothetical protein